MKVREYVAVDKIYLKVVTGPYGSQKSYFIGIAVILSEYHKAFSDQKYLRL